MFFICRLLLVTLISISLVYSRGCGCASYHRGGTYCDISNSQPPYEYECDNGCYGPYLALQGNSEGYNDFGVCTSNNFDSLVTNVQPRECNCATHPLKGTYCNIHNNNPPYPITCASGCHLHTNINGNPLGYLNGGICSSVSNLNVHYVVKLQRFTIMKTLGDPGSNEEWKIRYGFLRPGENTWISDSLGTTGLYDDYQDDGWHFSNSCNPPDSSSNLNYHCYPRLHSTFPSFCVNAGYSFKYELDFQIGDYDSSFDNGPIWDISYEESSLGGSAPERYFTRTGPEGRKARAYMIHYRSDGTCQDAGYGVAGNTGYVFDNLPNGGNIDVQTQLLSTTTDINNGGSLSCSSSGDLFLDGDEYHLALDIASVVTSEIKYVGDILTIIDYVLDTSNAELCLENNIGRGDYNDVTFSNGVEDLWRTAKFYLRPGYGVTIWETVTGCSGIDGRCRSLSVCFGEDWPQSAKYLQVVINLSGLNHGWNTIFDGNVGYARVERYGDNDDSSICQKLRKDYNIDPAGMFVARCNPNWSTPCEFKAMNTNDWGWWVIYKWF